MLNMLPSFVLGLLSPCDVAQGYVAVAKSPAASLGSILSILWGTELNACTETDA
jgi:hypothetical protein